MRSHLQTNFEDIWENRIEPCAHVVTKTFGYALNLHVYKKTHALYKKREFLY